jgi:hypothetical protein
VNLAAGVGLHAVLVAHTVGGLWSPPLSLTARACSAVRGWKLRGGSRVYACRYKL